MGEREGERIARAKCGCRRPSRFSLNLHLFYFRVPSLFSSSAAGTTFFSQLLHCNLNTSLFLSVFNDVNGQENKLAKVSEGVLTVQKYLNNVGKSSLESLQL